MQKLTYDINKYNFVDLVRQCFKVDDLEKIHLNLDNEYVIPGGVGGLGNDTDSHYHKLFYKLLNSGWEDFSQAYQRIIREVIMKYMNTEKIVYQSKPSFRIQYPNSKAVTTWHYDSDENHKHPEWEINVQIALTEMKDSTCTWIESVPGVRDFKPMPMVPGEMYIFNGNKCYHGNKPNKTNKTRVSMDFRVIPYDRYNPDFENQSATKRQKFLIGEYYSLMDLSLENK